MKVLQYILLFIGMGLLTNCQTGNSDSTTSRSQTEAEAPRAAQPPEPYDESYDSKKIKPLKLKIIKSGNIQFKVDDVRVSKSIIDTLLAKYEGYFAKDVLKTNDFQSTYDLMVRLPANQFEQFIGDIESGDGELITKQILANDVTEEFFDIESRLKNKRSYIETYTRLLNDAKKIEDILSIQNRIRILSEEIDVAEGRLRYLRDRVMYSTLQIKLVQYHERPVHVVQGPSIWTRMGSAAKTGWYGLLHGVVALIALWPLLLIIAAVVLFRKKLFRRREKGAVKS